MWTLKPIVQMMGAAALQILPLFQQPGFLPPQSQLLT
jgi:hypothetical protein